MKRLFNTFLCLIGLCAWRSQGSQRLGGEWVETRSCAKCGSHRYKLLTGEKHR